MQQKRQTAHLREEKNAASRAPEGDILWLRDFLFYRIPVAASYLLRETSRVCGAQKPVLTTPQWRIISLLANNPSLLASEISRICMLDEVAVSRALSVLARRGFVQRLQNRQDKRAREVSLTLEGWRYYGSVMPVMREQNDLIRNMFSETELAALYKALDRIDSVFGALSEERRLYGTEIELLDIIQREPPASSFKMRPAARVRKNA